MSEIRKLPWDRILDRIENKLPGEYWHHPSSQTHKAIHRFGTRMRLAAQGNSPVRYGTLKRAHRNVTKRHDNSASRGGSTKVSVVIHPNAAGPTGRPFIYGPKVHKTNPWMERTVDQDVPGLLPELMNDIIEAWQIWFSW